ncbi:UNVERIFIED_CONTAM: hypothetical protein K2H54_063177 [Gekko kuhli]
MSWLEEEEDLFLLSSEEEEELADGSEKLTPPSSSLLRGEGKRGTVQPAQGASPLPMRTAPLAPRCP